MRHEVLFDRICRENGIRHLLTAVRSPTTTGKIERFHRTLRDELFSTRSFSSIAGVQRALDHYVTSYNTLRPHQALGMATPIERFRLAGPQAAPLTGALEGEVIDEALPSEHIAGSMATAGSCGGRKLYLQVACCPARHIHSSNSSSASGDAPVSTTTVWSSNEHYSLSILSDRSRGHSAGSVYHPFSSSSKSAS